MTRRRINYPGIIDQDFPSGYVDGEPARGGEQGSGPMGIDRKAAIVAYKERTTPAGIYAVRCAATGQVWAGASRHLDTHRNGLWFALRMGSSPNRALQAAWTAHGEAAFAFEVVEQLPPETAPYLLQAELKERLAACRARLDALAA